MSHFTGILYEMRRASHDLRPKIPRAQRLKQLAFRASPLIAAATLGTGTLIARKMRDPPDAHFLGSRSAFECKADKQLLLRSELSKAGGDVEALGRAARRMRGPVERDLAAAECVLASDGAAPSSSLDRAVRALPFEVPSGSGVELRRQLWAKLVEVWRRAGYFTEPLEYQRPRPSKWADGVNPVTGEDESYGRDVGCEVPLCMLSEKHAEFHRLGPEQWPLAATALEQHGVVLLRSFLPASRVAALQEQLAMHTSALDHRKKKGTRPIREYDTDPLCEADPDLRYVYSSLGRKHFYLRGRLLEKVASEVQAGALPLIWEHFSAASSESSSSTRRPYISEIQLLVTEPGAVDQFWHVDNMSPGLTLVVPLTAVPEDMGPNLFVPGSHHLIDQQCSHVDRLQRCASSLFSSDGVAVGSMASGDAMLYDSRVIHRGAANRRYDRTAVQLVFRYDFERPPGHGATGTIGFSWAGSALAMLMSFYARLPGSR